METRLYIACLLGIILWLLPFSAHAEGDTLISEIVIEFTDNQGNVTDTYIGIPSADIFEHNFPVNSVNMKVMVDCASDEYILEMYVNGNTYGDDVLYDISEYSDINLDICFIGEENSIVEKAGVVLMRNISSRRPVIEYIEWRFVDTKQNEYYPDNIIFNEDYCEIYVPYSTAEIILDYFKTSEEEVFIDCIDENNNIYFGNEGSVIIDINNGESEMTVISHIDSKEKYYILRFLKNNFISDNNFLKSITVNYYDENNEQLNVQAIECVAEQYVYGMTVPTGTNYVYISAVAEEISTNLLFNDNEYYSQDFYYFYTDDSEVTIKAVAEDNSVQTYYINSNGMQELLNDDALDNEEGVDNTNNNRVSFYLFIFLLIILIFLFLLIILKKIKK